MSNSSDPPRVDARAEAQPGDGSWLTEVAQSACRDVGGVPVELLGDYLPLLADAAIVRPEAASRRARRGGPARPTSGRARGVRGKRGPALPVRGPSPMAAAAHGHPIPRQRSRPCGRRGRAPRGRRGRRQPGRGIQRRPPTDGAVGGNPAPGVHRGPAARRRRRGPTRGTSRAVRAGHGQAPPGRPGRADRAAQRRRISHQLHWNTRSYTGPATATSWWRPRTASSSPSHPPTPTSPGHEPGPKTLGDLMLAELSRSPRGRPWRVTAGRPYPGSYGIARSYEEAREGLTMAVRLHLDTPLIQAEQLLVYRVLLRDQPAIIDLVHSVLGQLVHSRGGAEPLLATLDAYFATGECHHRNRPPTAPVRPCGHLPPRPNQDAHRIRPRRPRTTVHHQRRRARRQAPRLAQARPDSRGLSSKGCSPPSACSLPATRAAAASTTSA